MKMTYRQEIRFGSDHKVYAPVGFRMGSGKTYKTNGASECERRRRQLANGSLRLN